MNKILKRTTRLCTLLFLVVILLTILPNQFAIFNRIQTRMLDGTRDNPQTPQKAAFYRKTNKSSETTTTQHSTSKIFPDHSLAERLRNLNTSTKLDGSNFVGQTKENFSQTVTLRSPTSEERRLLVNAKRRVKKFVWNVDSSSRDPREVHHAIYVKVHKAASTTIFNVFLRFAVSRGLNAMFPRTTNILSWHSPHLGPLLPHPPSPPFLFDLLMNHVIYNTSQLRPFFPTDTIRLASVRQPWDQFHSAYYYFKTQDPKPYLKRVSSVEKFLMNQSMYEPTNCYHSLTNNRMSVDLGLPPGQMSNSSYISTFLSHLDNDMDLVLTVERLDESLVLMKRLLHWTTKDIIYGKLNSNKHKFHSNVTTNSSLYQRFRQFQQFDFALYDHFSKVLDQKITTQGADFQNEVQRFQNINAIISDFCNQVSSETQVQIPASSWSSEFRVSRDECRVLKADELEVNSWGQHVQLVRLAPFIFHK